MFKVTPDNATYATMTRLHGVDRGSLPLLQPTTGIFLSDAYHLCLQRGVCFEYAYTTVTAAAGQSVYRSYLHMDQHFPRGLHPGGYPTGTPLHWLCGPLPAYSQQDACEAVPIWQGLQKLGAAFCRAPDAEGACLLLFSNLLAKSRIAGGLPRWQCHLPSFERQSRRA